MNRAKKLVRKYKYIIFIICMVANIPFAIKGNLLNMFTVGWCAGLIYCSLVNDEII